MELGKAIEILEDWVRLEKMMDGKRDPESDFDKFCKDRAKAIETVIKGLGEEYEKGYKDGVNDRCSRI